MPQVSFVAPGIHHRLAARLAVNVEEHRISFDRIKPGRFQAPTIQSDAFSYINLKKFTRGFVQSVQLFLELLIGLKLAHRFMRGQSN